MEPEGGADEPRKPFRHTGKGAELFRLYIVNLALSLVSLGFYRFWGKTRIRRYLWAGTRYLDEPLEYTGTGKELFLGFLVVLAVLLPLFLVIAVAQVVAQTTAPEYLPLGQFLPTLLILYLIPVAAYRARRYRLSRTLWRGIRSRQTGSAWRYGAMSLGFLVANVMTLGLLYPVGRVRLAGYRLNNTWFGDRRFRFDGRAGSLYKPFLINLALAVGTAVLAVGLVISIAGVLFGTGEFDLGVGALLPLFIPVLILLSAILPWFRYKAVEWRYLTGRTRYERLSFDTDVGWRGLAWLRVTNAILVVVTLTLAVPFVILRSARFVCRHLATAGEVDFEAIAQSQGELPERGEGLAEAFDVGDF